MKTTMEAEGAFQRPESGGVPASRDSEAAAGSADAYGSKVLLLTVVLLVLIATATLWWPAHP